MKTQSKKEGCCACLPLFLKIGFHETVPPFIFGIVEGCNVFRCDFQYYEFEHIYIGFGDTLQLLFWHTVESRAGFVDSKYLFIDIVVVYFRLAIDENASRWVWGVNQHGNAIVSFNVFVLSAIDERHHQYSTIYVSVSNRDGMYCSVFVVGANPRIVVLLKH